MNRAVGAVGVALVACLVIKGLAWLVTPAIPVLVALFALTVILAVVLS